MAQNLSPEAAFTRLIEGNSRFVGGSPIHPNQDADHRQSLAKGQEPWVTLFGCGDSRLAAEVIFDQGLGDMFIVRTAGHALDASVLGSLEFGVEGLHTPLLVVLGHDSCGAVTATKKAVETGVLPGGFQRNFIERILPATLSADLPDQASVNDLVRSHTRYTVERILEQSSIVSKAVEENRLAVVGLFYHLAQGTVEVVCTSDNIQK